MTQPQLDEQLVRRLADIAERLDGGDATADAALLDEFNRLAGTELPFSEFQGIYGGEDHESYVRRLLVSKACQPDAELGRKTLIAMFEKVLADPCDDAYLEYVFSTIKKSLGDEQISDLVFWPGEYFGDGNDQRELTPEIMADAVLERHSKREDQP